jgi:hypothetical protein
MWYIHMMEYYSAIKRRQLLVQTATWRKLKSIVLNGKVQKQHCTLYESIYMRPLGRLIGIDGDILVVTGNRDSFHRGTRDLFEIR